MTFSDGYQDAWLGREARSDEPDYVRGFEEGFKDRQSGDSPYRGKRSDKQAHDKGGTPPPRHGKGTR